MSYWLLWAGPPPGFFLDSFPWRCCQPLVFVCSHSFLATWLSEWFHVKWQSVMPLEGSYYFWLYPCTYVYQPLPDCWSSSLWTSLDEMSECLLCSWRQSACIGGLCCSSFSLVGFVRISAPSSAQPQNCDWPTVFCFLLIWLCRCTDPNPSTVSSASCGPYFPPLSPV